MLVWLLLLAFSLAFAGFAWINKRPARWILPSDAFFILTVLIAGSVPFLNLYAETPLFDDFFYSDATIETALISLSLMFLSFGFVWLLRPKIALAELLPHTGDPERRERDRRNAGPLLWLGAAAFVLISLGFMLHPPYLEFKAEVLKFLSGQILAEDYRDARRILFVDDPLIGEAMGRLRYGVLPMLFACLCIVALRRFGFVAALALAAAAFAIGPASLSKAPMFVYLLYFGLAAMLMKGALRPFELRFLLPSLAFGLPLLLLGLSGVYFLQYQGMDSLWDALSLSYFRVFVATYDGLLKYLTAFPNGDAGVSGIPLLAGLFGEQTRNLDLEAAYYFLGPIRGQYTSFPTVFIGNAYASFGYAGVVIYSLLVGWLLYLIDRAFAAIRNRDLRIAFYATMTVNVLFFAVMAAPTALLTYGNAILPLMILGADRLITPRRNGRRAAGYPQAGYPRA